MAHVSDSESASSTDSHNDWYTEQVTHELMMFIAAKSATFTCGGAIPIKDIEQDPMNLSSDPVASPVALRWDSADSNGGIAKLVFPIDATGDGKDGLLKLISDTQPASFGYKGEHVQDESYRKASKMDRSSFSVDFCPYELGIVDTITQMLLPNARRGYDTHGVKAELYKMNVYSAPSGFFKAHVDTPRSDTQFGSLVVSLPCYHQGGQLVVRHAKHSVTFDWGRSELSNKTEPLIQWAAFYSDCEHEVLEVTEGHRVTLTYNLYYALGVGDLAGNSPVMDVKMLPLYKKVQEALDSPNFMPNGGYLGIYCEHAYAHSTAEGINALPGILKGSDMAVFAVFQALHLKVAIRPVFDLDDFELGMNYDDEDSEPRQWDLIGMNLSQPCFTDRGGGDGEDPEYILAEANGERLQICWLTQPKNPSLGMVHLTYGNQPEIDALYTHAAIIVTVPKRNSSKAGGEVDMAARPDID
ncbi:hypothetical protein EJ04DRAFT_576923 [Polyplosphaeria fusca]|uniref:Fe2OG dioxygenase domain-containing protein n=1 Tax=Polyplosphaeria fusca TaxID=682080 RepID=A0A9P4V3K3_9PLEO|nr:hypothetical protein EJ04DRAFT_576923 [Polyplosphaeria fusca]